MDKNLLKSAVYGFAVGDALGVPHEFKKRWTFLCNGMKEYGTWEQPKGTWSDDTSMVLATCDSLMRKGKVDPFDLQKCFKSWAYEGKYAINNHVFDIGGTTSRALANGRGENDINSNGNGSLMRILPLAFIDCSNDDIRSVSSITHAHEISVNSCIIYVNIAKGLIEGNTLHDMLLKQKNLTKPFHRIYDIADIKEIYIRSTGYVVDTLEAALWCLTHTKSYEEAVLKAVNLGGDTDTIAAITGGLAGIMYGFDSIPTQWIDELRGKDLINHYIK